jgi:hypothetical protein
MKQQQQYQCKLQCPKCWGAKLELKRVKSSVYGAVYQGYRDCTECKGAGFVKVLLTAEEIALTEKASRV